MDNSKRIQRVSKIMQFTCLGLSASLVIFQLYFFVMLRLNPALVMPVVTERQTAIAISEAGLLSSIFASLFYMVPAFLVSYGLWHLSRTFKLYKEGAYFSNESVSHLLIFSMIGFVTQLTKPVLMGIAKTVSKLGLQENSFSLSITIDQQGVTQMLAWGTFIVVAWVLREGVALAQENSEFL